MNTPKIGTWVISKVSLLLHCSVRVTEGEVGVITAMLAGESSVEVQFFGKEKFLVKLTNLRPLIGARIVLHDSGIKAHTDVVAGDTGIVIGQYFESSFYVRWGNLTTGHSAQFMRLPNGEYYKCKPEHRYSHSIVNVGEFEVIL